LPPQPAKILGLVDPEMIGIVAFGQVSTTSGKSVARICTAWRLAQAASAAKSRAPKN